MMDKQSFRKKVYRARASAGGAGLEISLPAQLKDTGVIKVGDEVELLFNGTTGIIIITPPGKVLNTEKLATVLELIGV